MICLTPLADELALLDAELKPYKEKFARAERLRSVIRSLFAGEKAADEHVARGEAFDVTAGPCGFVSVIDRAALAKEIGAEKYCQIAVPTLDALQKHCSELVALAVVSRVQTGPRPLAIAARYVPVAAAVEPPKTAKTRAAGRKKAA